MYNLNEMIKNEKVEWRKLGDIEEIKVITPNAKIKKQNYLSSGLYPVIDQGQCFIVGYTNNKSAIFKKGSYVIFGDHTETVKYVDFEFAQGADGIKVLQTDEKYLNSRYLFHAILNYYKVTGKYMRHFSLLKDTIIPVPPIDVQHEIVRILDNFTELTAELTARKKQYEYYRDTLLDFNNTTSIIKNMLDKYGGVEYKELCEICAITSGGDIPKENYSVTKTENFTVPIISNGVGDKALCGYTDIPKITETAVTVSARGTIGYAEYRDYSYYPVVRLLSIIPHDKNKLNCKYLYYCLQDKKYNVPITGIPQLTIPMIKNILIPLPPLPVQEYIVNILDRFDMLCNDLTKGLPAEIEMRIKQYEYYRDSLLNFKMMN